MTNKLQRMGFSIIELPGCKLSRIGLVFDNQVTYEQWEDSGRRLRMVEGSVLWWIGDWLNFGERKWGEMYSQALDETDYDAGTLRNAKYVSSRVDLSRRRDNLSYSHHAEVASFEAKEQEKWLAKAEQKDWGHRELRQAIRDSKAIEAPPLPDKKYRCIVIDPPWPMEKIARDVRPAQVHMDYQTMSEEELRAYPLGDLAADDCHLYLWTTHRFLPLALELCDIWGFRYQCVMTWRKNVGITPFSWMYSTEHALFCVRGGLELLVKGKRLDFEAKVREHSRKPEEFYSLVEEVSPGPRIDLFSREKHNGFDQHGNETEKF